MESKTLFGLLIFALAGATCSKLKVNFSFENL